jgi:hypothetical protein
MRFEGQPASDLPARIRKIAVGPMEVDPVEDVEELKTASDDS